MIAIPLLIGLAPGLAWLFFFLQEDNEGDPPAQLGLAFISGAAFAFFALVLQLLLTDAFKGAGVPELGILAVTVFAAVEEICKFAAAYYSCHRSAAFDVPVDAMVFMVTVALGFATVENVAIALGQSASGDIFYNGLLETLALRFIGATLLHALTSGLVGYYWAIAILKGKRHLVAMGLVLAAGLHAFFNYLILNYGNAVYSVLFLAVIGFFVLGDFERLRNDKVNIRD